jgi:hypothetical protein
MIGKFVEGCFIDEPLQMVPYHKSDLLNDLLGVYLNASPPINYKGSEVIFGKENCLRAAVPANHAVRIKSFDLRSKVILQFKMTTFTPATGVRIPIAALCSSVRIPKGTFFHIPGNSGDVTPGRLEPAPTRHVRPFHNAKSIYADNSITDATARGMLTADDAKLIRIFIAEIKATKGISTGRANKMIFTLVAWRKFIGPFRENAVPDLYHGIEKLREAP